MQMAVGVTGNLDLEAGCKNSCWNGKWKVWSPTGMC